MGFSKVINIILHILKTTKMNILQSIWSKLTGWVSKEEPVAEAALLTANKFINVLKALGTSATGQTVIDIAEAFFPAATNIVSVIEGVLTDLSNFTATGGEGDVILQAIKKAATSTDVSKVLQYSNLATITAKAANDANKGTLTTQQALVANQLVYNPNILGDGTVSVTPTSSAAN